ncbi:hypothetical protein [Nocardiopsis rhodophaea]
MPDPRLDPVGYRRGQWWADDWLMAPSLVMRMEKLRLIAPYQHDWLE